MGGYYPASLRLKGASSSISLISRSGGLESSINVEGQGQSGVDGEINHRPNTGNQCVNRNDYTAVVADQGAGNAQSQVEKLQAFADLMQGMRQQSSSMSSQSVQVARHIQAQAELITQTLQGQSTTEPLPA